MRYYYLAASLPPLVLGKKPEISFEDFEESLRINLTKKDLKKCAVVRRWIDICNIQALLNGGFLEFNGNLNEKQLEEALLIRNILPRYVFDYLDERGERQVQLKDFPMLLAAFFDEEISKAEGFLRDYLIFEKELRFVLLALRSKSLKRDFTKELQFEDPHDPFVGMILAQKDSPEYEPPPQYAGLKQIWDSKKGDPLELAKAFNEYRLKKVDEMSEGALFSIDVILAYLVKLLLVEQWNRLDERQGGAIFNKLR
jgi:hypothetical protein